MNNTFKLKILFLLVLLNSHFVHSAPPVEENENFKPISSIVTVISSIPNGVKAIVYATYRVFNWFGNDSGDGKSETDDSQISLDKEIAASELIPDCDIPPYPDYVTPPPDYDSENKKESNEDYNFAEEPQNLSEDGQLDEEVNAVLENLKSYVGNVENLNSIKELNEKDLPHKFEINKNGKTGELTSEELKEKIIDLDEIKAPGRNILETHTSMNDNNDIRSSELIAHNQQEEVIERRSNDEIFHTIKDATASSNKQDTKDEISKQSELQKETKINIEMTDLLPDKEVKPPEGIDEREPKYKLGDEESRQAGDYLDQSLVNDNHKQIYNEQDTKKLDKPDLPVNVNENITDIKTEKENKSDNNQLKELKNIIENILPNEKLEVDETIKKEFNEVENLNVLLNEEENKIESKNNNQPNKMHDDLKNTSKVNSSYKSDQDENAQNPDENPSNLDVENKTGNENNDKEEEGIQPEDDDSDTNLQDNGTAKKSSKKKQKVKKERKIKKNKSESNVIENESKTKDDKISENELTNKEKDLVDHLRELDLDEDTIRKYLKKLKKQVESDEVKNGKNDDENKLSNIFEKIGLMKEEKKKKKEKKKKSIVREEDL